MTFSQETPLLNPGSLQAVEKHIHTMRTIKVFFIFFYF